MRYDDDQWEITTSVGATALAVAAARAVESRQPNPLVADPYADSFVTAAEAALHRPLRWKDPDPTTKSDASATDDPAQDWRIGTTYIGVRSRYFDHFFAEATEAGIRQAVILAAGLDTRALRLAWPEHSVVYEVDQPLVLRFKDQVLGEHAASAGIHRVTVPTDLRRDWPAALRASGFDRDVPTAWLAEGLLPYLPPQAQENLFDLVDQLSGPGSRIAVEYFADLRNLRVLRDVTPLTALFDINIRDLIYPDPEANPVERLAARGWSVTPSVAAEVAQSYGRPLAGHTTASFGKASFLTARKP
jgi:methyltransferase (TIGR00027 family)